MPHFGGMEQLRFRRHKAPRKHQNRITIPDLAGPHVKLVFAEMYRQRKTYDEVEDGSGILRSTMKAWRHKNAPGLTSIEAVLNFLGLDFVPVPRADVLTPEIVAELQPIADRLGLAMPKAIEAAISIAVRERGTVGSLRASRLETLQ